MRKMNEQDCPSSFHGETGAGDVGEQLSAKSEVEVMKSDEIVGLDEVGKVEEVVKIGVVVIEAKGEREVATPSLQSLPDDILVAILRHVSLSSSPAGNGGCGRGREGQGGSYWYALVCRKWSTLSTGAHAAVSAAVRCRPGGAWALDEHKLLGELRPFRALQYLHVGPSSVLGTRCATPASANPLQCGEAQDHPAPNSTPAYSASPSSPASTVLRGGAQTPSSPASPLTPGDANSSSPPLSASPEGAGQGRVRLGSPRPLSGRGSGRPSFRARLSQACRSLSSSSGRVHRHCNPTRRALAGWNTSSPGGGAQEPAVTPSIGGNFLEGWGDRPVIAAGGETQRADGSAITAASAPVLGGAHSSNLELWSGQQQHEQQQQQQQQPPHPPRPLGQVPQPLLGPPFQQQEQQQDHGLQQTQQLEPFLPQQQQQPVPPRGGLSEAFFLAAAEHMSQLKNFEVEVPSSNIPASALATFFRRMGSLERLELRGLRGAYHLPEAISCLRALRHLVTPNTHSLPDSVSTLGALRTLILRNVGLTAVPPQVATIPNLADLQLYCTQAVRLPPGPGRLTSLTSLTIFSRELQVLPDSLLELRALRMLHLTCPALLELPPGLSALGRLKVVKVSAWWQALGDRDPAPFRSLPESLRELPRLRRLEFTTWGGRPRVPQDLGLLTSLRHLHLRCHGSFGELPSSISHLSHLRFLSLSHPASHLPPDLFCNMPEMQHLEIHNCFRLKHLGDPPQWTTSTGRLSNLRTLKLTLCLALKSLPSFVGQLGRLRTFILDRCPELVELPASLGGLTSLEELSIFDCGSLTSIPSSIGDLSALQTLKLHKLGQVQSLPLELGRLKSLRILEVQGLKQLRELPASLCLLCSLDTLSVSGCPLGLSGCPIKA